MGIRVVRPEERAGLGVHRVDVRPEVAEIRAGLCRSRVGHRTDGKRRRNTTRQRTTSRRSRTLHRAHRRSRYRADIDAPADDRGLCVCWAVFGSPNAHLASASAPDRRSEALKRRRYRELSDCAPPVPHRTRHRVAERVRRAAVRHRRRVHRPRSAERPSRGVFRDRTAVIAAERPCVRRHDPGRHRLKDRLGRPLGERSQIRRAAVRGRRRMAEAHARSKTACPGLAGATPRPRAERLPEASAIPRSAPPIVSPIVQSRRIVPSLV